MDFFIENIYLIILLPIWISLIIGLNNAGNFSHSKKSTLILTLASTFIGFLFSSALLYQFNLNSQMTIENSFEWIKFNNFSINLGIFVDKIAAIFLFTLMTISFIVHIYSYGYMKDQQSFHRFFIYLNLFNSAMIGFILSPNLIQSYIFLELLSVISYLLISFNNVKMEASRASIKAFIINRIGDIGLLVGILTLIFYSLNFSETSSYASLMFADFSYISKNILAMLPSGLFNILCFFILLSALAKSAQFPFSTWLIEAMEAPTPASALIHAATLVASGIFLIIRLLPLFSLSDEIMFLIIVIGITTAILMGLAACIQMDIKKILAYSTASQLGVMLIPLGLNNYNVTFSYLNSHAYIKAFLFLIIGIIFYIYNRDNNIFSMGSLRKFRPYLAILYLFSVMSLSGILFSGAIVKDSLFQFLWDNHYFIIYFFTLLISFITSFYIARSYFIVFEGERHSKMDLNFKSFSMYISVTLLFVFNILLSFIFYKNYFDFKILNIMYILPITISCIGFLSVFMLFRNKSLYNSEMNKIQKFILKGYYIDELYAFIVNIIYKNWCKILYYFDKFIIDGISNLVSFLTKVLSNFISKLQNGNINSYIVYSFILIVFLASISLVYYYKFIITKGLIS